MSQTATSPADAALLVALEQNEFDIAGLADFCSDQRCIDLCLRQLYLIIQRHREPSLQDKKLLAQVLMGMIYVARHDYAADGHQEYWPFLFDRVRAVAIAEGDRVWNDALCGQQYQSLLGRWFLAALEAFGYSIPDEGQKYVGPIVFHAGMPSSSLARVLSVIAMACDQFGPQVISLPADIRSELVRNRFLHRNVERLLSSTLQGAAQLWGSLARVVLAWRTLGECSDELQQLPLALDPDEVRDALPLESENAKVSRAALPLLRYDPETGETRMTVPSEVSTDWSVTTGGFHVDLMWSRTHLARTAEFSGPLPQEILVAPKNSTVGITRTFFPYPSEWPGYWFHAQNGSLEDGRAIDASGLPSGRWYVVFEGTPTKCSVPFVGQVLLKWSWFKGNSDWTAWEVEVPARTASRTHLEWFVGDNCFRVPLARRPGPRVEFTDTPIVQAKTPDGSQLDVYAVPPTIILRREVPISLQLVKETTDSIAVVERLELKPETATPLTVLQAGVYQLCESRGVGRTLLRFAIVPELQIQGPHYGPQRHTASVMFSAAEDAGQLSDNGSVDLARKGRIWVIQSPTVEPVIKAQWCWSDNNIPPLTFSWPLESLRWRITHSGDEYSRWTREPVFISPKRVAEVDVQLEIQTPVGSELLINGERYAGRCQTSPSGNTVVLSLLSYGESVELELDGERYAAVLQTERPLIDAFEGIADSDSVIVNWKAPKKHTGMVIVAWDPCDVLSSPKTYSLSDSDLNSGEWGTACEELPGKEFTAISLARSAGGFFQKALQLAARRTQTLEPVSFLLQRSTGECRHYGSDWTRWPSFLFHVSVLRWYQHEPTGNAISKLLPEIDSARDLDVAIRVGLDLEQLLNATTTNDRDRRWASAVYHTVLRVVRHACRNHSSLAFAPGDVAARFTGLLDLGVPVGRLYPFHSIATCDSPHEAATYPLTYIRDLWLLGTGRKYLELQMSKVGASVPHNFDELQMVAARRVLQFHEANALPSISRFLPLGRRVATTDSTDRGHRHSFALPPLLDSFETSADLCEVLGLQDKALDCQATSDDQFFDLHSSRTGVQGGRRRMIGSPAFARTGYSLYWCVEDNRWAIENLSSPSPTCCYTNGQPLIVDPLTASMLADSCVRDALISWTRDERILPDCESDFSFLHPYRERLVADAVSGLLHAELFRPAEIETKELFGRAIQVETRASLPPLALIAWKLAWIDRVVAWEGEERVFANSDDNSLVQRTFLRGLARALTLWPNLMRRTVALVEIVYWTLYRGGLGASARFQGSHTDEQLAALRDYGASQNLLQERQAASHSPTGDRAVRVPGMIIGYNAGVGVILLHHRRSPSFDATVKDYLDHGDEARHWFASFRWRTLDASTRDRVQRMYSERSTGKHRKSTLADVLCGLQVTCEVQKSPKWEAVSMDIDFTTGQAHEFPKHRRRQPI